MKFSVLVAIVPEEMEQECIDAARELGAGGITILQGRGIANEAKKSFFGLNYDGCQSVLLMVLEKQLSLQVLKTLKHLLDPEGTNSKGLVFTTALEHLAGIDMSQVTRFERTLKQTL